MGLSNSKIVTQSTKEKLEKTSVPSTPISTPQTERKNEIDPRSPSTNISRTPLELESSFTIEEHEIESGEVFYSPVKEQMTQFGIDPRSPTTAFYRTPIVLNTSKNNLLLNTSEDSEEVFGSPITTNTRVLGIDPRSPTNEFVRTPIVVSAVNDNLVKVLHNKNLEKVIQSEICTTPSFKKERATPKLLESSPIKQRRDSYKRKSFVGLLETNVDFTETDIDAVLREKCRIKGTNNADDPIFKTNTKESSEILPHIDVTDDISKEIELPLPESDFEIDTKETCDEVFDQAFEKFDNCDLNEIVDLLVKESKEDTNCTEPEFDTEKIIQKTENKMQTPQKNGYNVELPITVKSAPLTPRMETSPLKCLPELNSAPVTPQQYERKTPPKSVKEKEVLAEIKSAPLTPRIKSMLPKCVQESKSAPVTPPLINITADVKELDKKLTNLIYEDQDIVVCPRIVQLKDVLDRSPLRNRNKCETETRKSAQKLKVSDKPRKSDYAVSKIPVFKSAGKGKIQCENTPPRNMERMNKSDKKSHWDNKDVTLYL